MKRVRTKKATVLLVGLCASTVLAVFPRAATAEVPAPPVDAQAPPGDVDDVGQAPATETVEAAPVAPEAAVATEIPAEPARGTATRLSTRSATVVFRSFTPEATMSSVVTKVEELGGYVQSSETGETQMKVPMLALDTTLTALRDLGEVVEERVDSEDVTLEIVTIEARIQELESSRARVKGMLALSGNVGDSLSIERELQQVTQELEHNEGRLRFLKNRTHEAPLTLRVSMKARPPVERPSKRRPFEWVADYGPSRLLR